jgi:hypothetical protein
LRWPQACAGEHANRSGYHCEFVTEDVAEKVLGYYNVKAFWGANKSDYFRPNTVSG